MSALVSVVAPLAPVASHAAAGDFANGAKSASMPFENILLDAVGSIKQLEAEAQRSTLGLMAGSGIDVHQALIATQKADMAFELALSVRNKAVQAYQNVMQMQF